VAIATGKIRLPPPNQHIEVPVNIKLIIDLTVDAKFCISNGSDFVAQTAYYLITKMLNYDSIEAFNAFINEIGPAIFSLEGQTIMWLVTNPNENNIEENTLASRFYQLYPSSSLGDMTQWVASGQPLPPPVPVVLPTFIPRHLQRTTHIDPDLGTNIKFI
jgi:hypothetical protein